MDSTAWNAVSAIAAAIAATVAAFQLIQLRRDARRARQAELNSVAVVTHVRNRPLNSKSVGVRACWDYDVEVVNPGRLPITEVEAVVEFPGLVERSHFDGSLEPAAKTLTFYTPVIAPGEKRTWHRSIWMDGAVASEIRRTFATVQFSSPDSGKHELRWPPPR